MTTKILTGNYAAGYYIGPPITILSIAASGYVGGFGIYTPLTHVISYKVVNDGTVIGGTTGIHLKNGGEVINGGAANTTATIAGGHGGFGIEIAGAASTVTNYGRIVVESPAANSAAVLLTKGGLVTNGSLRDPSAYLEASTGVRLSGGPDDRVDNFGFIVSRGTQTACAGVVLAKGGTVANGALGDTDATIIGYSGVVDTSGAGTVANFGRIVGDAQAGIQFYGAGGGVVVNGGLHDTVAQIDGANGIVGLATTVTNYGTIAGGVAILPVLGLPDYGVRIVDNSRLTNGSPSDGSALIQGAGGVYLRYASTAQNYGTIDGSELAGAHVDTASSLTNEAAATVEGWSGAYVTGVLTNFGAVAGAGGISVEIGATGELVAEAGSVLKGAVAAGAGVVDFVGGAIAVSAIQSAGTVEGAGTVDLDGGASTFSPGVQLTVARIDVAGAATSVAFDASATLARVWDQSAGTLTAAKGETVSFTGTGDHLSGTLAGFGAVTFAGGSDAFSNLTLAAKGQAIDNAAVSLFGAIVIDRPLTVEAATLTVFVGGATVSGNLALVLTESATSRIVGASSAAMLTDNGTIRGSGELGAGKLTLVVGASGKVNGDLTTALTIDTGARTITNAGVIEATNTGGVLVQSAVDNTGVLRSLTGTLTVDGAVTGAGQVEIEGGTADFASTVTQNVTFTTSGTLELARSQSYVGSITGFSKTGTTSLDLADIAYVKGKTTAVYAGTTSSGTLTVKNATHTAVITFTGDYTASKWILSSDGHGGTRIVDPGGGSPAHSFIASAAGFGAEASGWTSLAAETWRARQNTFAMPRARFA